MEVSLRCRRVGAAIVTILLGSSAAAAQTSQVAGFRDDVVFSGLVMPTAVRFAPDGRVFVAEKSGLIKVFDSLSDTQPDVFADLRTQVHNFWDRGLLGIALDPQFAAEPYVYVLYTRDAPIGGAAPVWGSAGQTNDPCPTPPGPTENGCPVSGRLSRLRASGNIASGEQVLVDGWFQQFPVHSMGSIVFGPDGSLYASAGEGGTWQFTDYGQRGNPGGDPPVPVGGTQTSPTAEGGSLRAQDLRTSGDPVGLSGSVIRVDRRTGAPLPDNPLFSHADVNARRIVAYGMRNPYRMTVRPGTHELWVGDVGWTLFDEVNRIVDPRASVLNFGWPCYEGGQRQPAWDSANLNICEGLYAQTGAVTSPYYQYRQGVAIVSGEACPFTDAALSGLAFYTGGTYPPEYVGALFFADYARRCVWVMPRGADGLPDRTRVATFITSAAYPVDLQTGPGGDLFYADFDGGTIHRIRYTPDNEPPRAVLTASPDSGEPPLRVQFDGSGSSDPEGTPLTYDWDLDGNGLFGDATVVAPVRTFEQGGAYRVQLRVRDGNGLTDTASLTVTVGNTRPTATITTPTTALRWRVGQSIAFSGQGSDPEEGTLPARAFAWSLLMHHCSTPTSCHTHPIQSYAGIASGSFIAPDHEYPSYLELRLTVTDSGGLSHLTTLRLEPQTVQVTVDSAPTGLQLGLGSEAVRGRQVFPAIVGSTLSLSASSPQTLNGTSYSFASWSDGGAATHTATVPASATSYIATFAPAAAAGEIVMHTRRATVTSGGWRLVADASAAGGQRMEHPDAGAAKIPSPLATPTHYFELQFDALAGRPYHLWLRGRAAANTWANDSVYVQFDRSVDRTGAAVTRIGSTSAGIVTLEDCLNCGVALWGWQDNGFGAGVNGPDIYFAQSGRQTIRIQTREDGFSIDQVVLSPAVYLTTAPGALKRDATILAESAGGPAAAGEVVLYAAQAAVRAGGWQVTADAGAAGGRRIEHPDAGAAKLSAPLASPVHYFELQFAAVAGRAYHVWIRGRAAGNHWANDSVFVQFNRTVDASGNPIHRIGTTNAAIVTLEDCIGCGVANWGWQDNGFGAGVNGAHIYFAESGTQTIRIQTREDGFSIDQIVVSPATYLTASPGTLKNDVTILPATP